MSLDWSRPIMFSGFNSVLDDVFERIKRDPEVISNLIHNMTRYRLKALELEKQYNADCMRINEAADACQNAIFHQVRLMIQRKTDMFRNERNARLHFDLSALKHQVERSAPQEPVPASFGSYSFQEPTHLFSEQEILLEILRRFVPLSNLPEEIATSQLGEGSTTADAYTSYNTPQYFTRDPSDAQFQAAFLAEGQLQDADTDFADGDGEKYEITPAVSDQFLIASSNSGAAPFPLSWLSDTESMQTGADTGSVSGSGTCSCEYTWGCLDCSSFQCVKAFPNDHVFGCLKCCKTIAPER